MIITNLTDKQQKVSMKEVAGEHRVYDIYLEPHGSTEVFNMVIIEPTSQGIISIDGKLNDSKKSKVSTSVEPKIIEEPKVEEKVEVPLSETEEKVEEPTVETTDAFICDICGAEFASARGLATHKNKAHSE